MGKKFLKRLEKNIVRETNKILHKQSSVHFQPVPVTVTESVPEIINEPVPEIINEPVPEIVNEPVPEIVNEPVSATVNEPAAATINEPDAEMVEEPVFDAKEVPVSEMKEESVSETKEEPVSETKEKSASKIKSEMKKDTKMSLADDLVSLFQEGTLCDVKLRTDSETFSVHKVILSARSPVFKNMFTIDMREKSNDRVVIEDLDADTLRRMLMFLYTDTTSELDWQSAMELYFAADKYQIDSLRLECSNFLKLNVQPSNCCDLLLLSDMHQDADLKQFVQEYILLRDKDVFGSDEWKIFMKNHVQLSADTMYLRYTGK